MIVVCQLDNDLTGGVVLLFIIGLVIPPRFGWRLIPSVRYIVFVGVFIRLVVAKHSAQ
jgi:hypothetical protein